ncbi:hypothetical protein Tco_1137195 [Tanacetum coccineum]
MEELNPSDSGAQEHQEDFDPWERNELGEEHQYHLDQMKSYMEIQIVWESKKEDLSLQIPKKPALVFHSCERDPNAPSLVLVNKDLFYMKNGNSKTRMYVVEHWKSIWAKKAHIKRQLKQRDDPEEVYSEQRIVNVIRVQYDQGYGQEYMKEIMVKRVDGEYKSFTESDYKYLHKDDIEDMYLMCMNGKIKDYQETEQKPYTITSLPFVGLIYENSKKEKRIMDIDEISKFYDATLKRVLKNVKKINLDVKHDYADPTLNKDDAEYMVFYKRNIEERLRHRD